MIGFKINKIKSKDIITILILCLIIIQSGSLQFALTFVEENIQTKICAVILLGMLAPFIIIEFKRLAKVYLISFFVLSYFLCVDFLLYPESFFSLLMRLLWFLGFLGFCEYKKRRENNVFRIFSEIIVVLAFISLVFWFLICVLGLYNLGFTEMKTATMYSYYNWHGIFGYTPFYAINIFGLNAYRLQGMFWEPGVYQFFLNLSIYHFLFERKEEKNKFKLILLYTNLALTLSTTGMCIGILLLGVYITNLPKFRSSKKLLVLISTILVSIASGYVVYVKYMESVHNIGIGSMATRVNDQIVGFKLFCDNFIFGAGYDNTPLFEAAQGWGRGSSSGFMCWMYMMGIVGLVAVIYPFIKNILNSKTQDIKRKRILLFIIFILCNFSEPLYWAPLNWFWVASEYIKSHTSNKIGIYKSNNLPEIF